MTMHETQEAQAKLAEYLHSSFDEDDNVTRISELNDIIKLSNGFYPYCHLIIAKLYLQEKNIPKSLINITIAREQDPIDIEAVLISTCINAMMSEEQNASFVNNSFVRSFMNADYGIGLLSSLSVIATTKGTKALFGARIRNDINYLMVKAIPETFQKIQPASYYNHIGSLLIDIVDDLKSSHYISHELNARLIETFLKQVDRLEPVENEEEKLQLNKNIRKLRSLTKSL